MIPTFEQVKEAQQSFPAWISHTRLLPVHIPGCEAEVYVKTECLQRTGAFKVRGAYNRVRQLTDEEKKAGVLASSAGNHAQGVALAAREMGIKATIVMPRFAPLSKVNATRALGAEVVLHGDIYDDAYAHARELEKSTGAIFIHPFDDPMVIAGQGTISLEIFEDLPDVDVILVPVGGGGLAAGVAMAAKTINSPGPGLRRGTHRGCQHEEGFPGGPSRGALFHQELCRRCDRAQGRGSDLHDVQEISRWHTHRGRR